VRRHPHHQQRDLDACRRGFDRWAQETPEMRVWTNQEGRTVKAAFLEMSGANVVLLDEPTAGMSKSETKRFIDLIREVTVGKTLLTVEHDMGVVFGLADKIAVVVYGEVIAFDTPEAVRANERVQEAYLGSVLADAQAAGAAH
jgi:branched-chain amino acid transport system ATP-binding protein